MHGVHLSKPRSLLILRKKKEEKQTEKMISY